MTTLFRCKNISTVFIRHFALALSRAESTLLRADAPLFRRDRVEHRWPTRRTEATCLLHPGRDVAVQSMWSAIEIFCSRVVFRQRFFRKNNEMADEYDANAGSASSRIRFLPVQAQPTAARSSRRAQSRTVVTLGDILT